MKLTNYEKSMIARHAEDRPAELKGIMQKNFTKAQWQVYDHWKNSKPKAIANRERYRQRNLERIYAWNNEYNKTYKKKGVKK